jgi:hypothetical protein
MTEQNVIIRLVAAKDRKKRRKMFGMQVILT